MTPRQAVEAAGRGDAVIAERAEHGRLRARAAPAGSKLWDVRFDDGAKVRAQVLLSDRTGRIVASRRGLRIDWALARGRESAFVPLAAEPLVVAVMAFLMLLPFVDFACLRRRAIHFDLLALAALSVSMAFFAAASVKWSTLLVYPVLGYLFIRALSAGYGSAARRGPLLPHVGARFLLVGLGLLVLARVALQAEAGDVIDVGYASVAGADLVAQGRSVYEGGLPSLNGDTYGPVVYLAYVPFEAIFPWRGTINDVPAAKVAALTFDVLTMAALFVAGIRARRGHEGRLLGLALAWAWAACPFTAYSLALGSNDALVALLVTLAVVVALPPFARGCVVAMAALTKFVPAVLVPVVLRGAASAGDADRPSRVRASLVAAAGATLVVSLTVYPQLPEGTLWGFWYRTLGWQLGRDSPFSLWGVIPALKPLQAVLLVGMAGFAIAMTVQRPVSRAQLAARAAAAILGVEIALSHWFYPYVCWFLPPLLFALFALQREVAPRPAQTMPRA